MAPLAEGIPAGEPGYAKPFTPDGARKIAPLPPHPAFREHLNGWHAVLQATKKICVLGDPGVGKTSIIRRYALDSFDETYVTTVGARILNRTQVLKYPERGVELRLQYRIWEVSGQNQHLELYPAYYRGAEGAIVVGDATRVETQINMWKWIESFRAAAGRVPIILLLNKTDLSQSEEVDARLLDEISREFGCPCRQTSARDGTNVDRVFRELAGRMVNRRSFHPSKSPDAG
jgi:small GTP-binding protein